MTGFVFRATGGHEHNAAHTRNFTRSFLAPSYEIHYSFQLSGRTYSGNTYNLGDSDFSGYQHASDTVSKLASGTLSPCYYDPTDPTRSTIARTLETNAWFGLLPMVFTAAGFLGGRVRTAKNRFVGFISLLLCNVVWNGIVAIGSYAFFAAGSGGWIVGLLIFPFAWKVNGSTRRVSKLAVKLELLANPGTITMIQSSNQRASSKKESEVTPPEIVVHTIEIFSTMSQDKMKKGTCSVRIPETSELSLGSDNKPKKWRLTVALEIPWYPDSSDAMQLDAAE